MSYLYDMKTETQNFAEIISESLHVEQRSSTKNGRWSALPAASFMIRSGNGTSTIPISPDMYLIPAVRSSCLIPVRILSAAAAWKKISVFIKPVLLSDSAGKSLLRRHQPGRFQRRAKEKSDRKQLSVYAVHRKDGGDPRFQDRESIIAEKQIATNEYLNTIIASVHEGIIACDADGKITCFNQTAEEKLGISSTAAAGRPVEEILPGSLLARALKSGASIYEKSIQYRDAGGKPIHLISNVTLVRKSDQLLGAVESFNTDESLFRIAQRLLQNDGSAAFHNIIGESQALREVKLRAGAIAKGPSTVLLTGESGTGKELFARAIHNASLRADFPFIPINCSAIPDALLESELFGYESGAFTGARASGKPGIFELAKGGTIFLMRSVICR